MALNCQAFTRLFASVEALGAQVPPSMTAALASVEAIRKAVLASSGDPVRVMVGAVKEAADAAQPIAADEARALCVDLVAGSLVSDQLAPHLTNVDFKAATLIHKMLQGDAGDELMAGLRPIVVSAADGIRRASDFFDPDTTAEQVVGMEPEAVAAWKDATRHQQVLDRVLGEILRPLTWELEILPPEVSTDATLGGDRLLGVWVIDPDRAYMLDEVGLMLAKSMSAFSTPGGRWLKVQQMCGLRLNSPRQVIDMLRSLKQSRTAEAAERAARPIGRAGRPKEPLSPPIVVNQ